jgi:Uma2 family endonuclease
LRCAGLSGSWACQAGLRRYIKSMNWLQLCHDRSLAGLPYKVELDKSGKIIMNPATKRRSKLQIKIQRLLVQLMDDGDPLPECAVETAEGTKVADVAWISDARWRSMNPDEASCSVAPEICVEILSPANTREEMLGTPNERGKRDLYLQAGAKEFWICSESGHISFYDVSGQIEKSKLCPGFPEKI